jgi:transcriptional regulator with XRE-family HTH domain
MQSRQKTPVAVLRLLLGLTVEGFAGLIGKAPSTITSLESGRLALSEETAFRIKRETGVSLEWLLKGRAKDKPYVRTLPNGSTEPYTKEVFERVQTAKLATDPPLPMKPEYRIFYGLEAITDWLSVYYHAEEKGEGELAKYLMRNFLNQLIDRLGKDDAAFMRANEKTEVITPSSAPLNFCYKPGDERIWLQSVFRIGLGKKQTPKSEPSAPSPENAHRDDDRKSASPRRRRHDARASD